MKITSRCGETAVAALNEALLARAHEAKVIKTDRVRADTTVVEANVAYPTDSGLLAKGVAKMAAAVARLKAMGLATRTTTRDRTRSVRSLRRHAEAASGKAAALVAELERTAALVGLIAAQTRLRLSGQTADGATRVVSPASRCSGDGASPSWSSGAPDLRRGFRASNATSVGGEH